MKPNRNGGSLFPSNPQLLFTRHPGITTNRYLYDGLPQEAMQDREEVENLNPIEKNEQEGMVVRCGGYRQVKLLECFVVLRAINWGFLIQGDSYKLFWKLGDNGDVPRDFLFYFSKKYEVVIYVTLMSKLFV